MAKIFSLISLALLLIATGDKVDAAVKKRNWQIGKILDSEQSQRLDGDFKGQKGQKILIEGETYLFVGELSQGVSLLLLPKALPSFTVNEKVKFAIEGRKLFVLDDEGKEYSMEIVKKVLRQEADNSTTRVRQAAPQKEER